MTYSTKDAKKARRELEDKLIDLYIDCKTFDEFKLKALQLHSYRCHFFDPFWRAYAMILHPVLYWLCMHLAFFLASACASVLLSLLLGSFYWIAAFPVFWLAGFPIYTYNVGYHVIYQILFREGIRSEIY